MTGAGGPAIGARLGAGREADVHAWTGATVGEAVVKLYRHDFGGHRAEATALAALDGLGIAPRLISTVDCDGRIGLVLERLPGRDMLTLLQHQPWHVLGQAHAMAKAHLAIHKVRAPRDLPDLREVLAARIEDAALPEPLRGFVLRTLDWLPAGDRLCHGDYHPGNVLVADDRIGVIDWPGASRGVPEADHAHTILLLRWADPLPDTPLLSRALTAAGRSLLAYSYARAYTAGSPHPMRQVNSWLIVRTAARLAEGIDAERKTLTGLFGTCLANAAAVCLTRRRPYDYWSCGHRPTLRFASRWRRLINTIIVLMLLHSDCPRFVRTRCLQAQDVQG